MKTSIGDRVKKYELSSRTTLLPRGYIVLRVDGKAFHSFTRKMEKPFDFKLIESMIIAGEKTAKNINGFVLGYHQSDEFTFVLTDTKSFESQYWFNGEVQKLCSITASMFGAYFNSLMGGTEAIFDCRAFNVPKEDVANVFIWRQKDWERNSIQMFARSLFSHKQLDKKSTAEIKEMILSKGENFDLLRDYLKYGTFIRFGDGRTRISKELGYYEITNLL